jgi:hypothetical protein
VGADKSSVLDWGTLQSIGRNCHYLLDSCPFEDEQRVYKMFLNRNWEALSKARVPWFLPEALGGLGLPISLEYQPSAKDLRIAAVVYHHFTLPRAPLVVPWKTWQYATKRAEDFEIPKLTSSYSEFGTESSRTDVAHINEVTLMGRLCVEALFRVPGIKDLYSEKTTVSKALNQMEKIWSKATKSEWMEKTQPFELDKLPNQALYKRFLHLYGAPARRADVCPVPGALTPMEMSSLSFDLVPTWTVEDERDW